MNATANNSNRKKHFVKGARFLASSQGRMAVWKVLDRREIDGKEIITTEVMGILRTRNSYDKVKRGEAKLNHKIFQPVSKSNPFYQKRKYTRKQIGFLHTIRDKMDYPVIRLIQQQA